MKIEGKRILFTKGGVVIHVYVYRKCKFRIIRIASNKEFDIHTNSFEFVRLFIYFCMLPVKFNRDTIFAGKQLLILAKIIL